MALATKAQQAHGERMGWAEEAETAHGRMRALACVALMAALVASCGDPDEMALADPTDQALCSLVRGVRTSGLPDADAGPEQALLSQGKLMVLLDQLDNARDAVLFSKGRLLVLAYQQDDSELLSSSFDELVELCAQLTGVP